ncbi:hypothetical protein ACK3TF_001950 [Chlorella vulgaris]
MERFRRAASYKAKAQIIIEIAARQERARHFVDAIASYSTYIRCMAVHCFKEADRKKKDEMINMAQHSRTIYAHRMSLKNRATQEANSCCGPSFVWAEPSAPQVLAPYEWSSWLAMLRSGESVEAMLKKMGLIKMESKETIALRLAEASKATTNVSVALNNSIKNESRNEVNPNINVAGPTTNIAANPNMSNAQTGEGNVAPNTGGGGMQQQAGAMMMVPTGSGAFMMMPAGSGVAGGSSFGSGSMGGASMGGSGDQSYMAMMAAQQQMAALMQQNQMLAAQQQQMMAMAGMQQQGMGGMQGMQGMQPGMQPGMQQAYYNPQQMQGMGQMMGQGMPGGSGNMAMGMQGMGMGMGMANSGPSTPEGYSVPEGYPVTPAPGVPAPKMV